MAKTWWLGFGMLFVIVLVNNWSLPLWDQDEAAYAGFARNMIQIGDWLVPNFMWSEVHRKPPLHFWNIAISYRLFGVNEFAVRFPSLLAILGTYLLVFFQGRKFVSERAAFWSMLVLGSSFLVPALAKISVTDATLLFCSTLCAISAINVLLQSNWKWILWFWVGFGFGLLTKGPPIIIFSSLFVVLLFVFHPSRFSLLKLRPWFFLPLALLPFVLWCYFTYLRDGGQFLSWMYDWYILKRIDGQVFGQTGPPGTHLLGLFLFFLPFAMYFPVAFRNSFSGFFKKDSRLIILGAWFISGWLLYEFSPSKLPAYVIASHVPLALLIGKYIDALQSSNSRPHLIPIIIHYTLNFALAAAFFIVPIFLPLSTTIKIILGSIGSLYLLGLVIQLFQWKREKFFGYQISFSITFLVVLWSFSPVITNLLNSTERVGEHINLYASKNSEIYVGNSFGHPPSLPFYIGSPMNKITELPDKTTLFEHVDDSVQSVFILNEEQTHYFKMRDSSMVFHHITSYLIDRKGETDYYIYINDGK